jgi:GLPGLI family protein
MKTLITASLILFAISLTAQDFQGKAIYKTSAKSNFKIKDNQKGIDDKMKEELQKRIQKMNQKTFILEFDKTSSIYKQEAALQSPKSQAGRVVNVMSFGGSGSADIYYKNIKENRFANKTEIMGKAFLVEDKLPKYDWELTSETKNIGIYTCYKATFSKEVENTNISMKDGETIEEKTKQTIVTTAWYTMQIPVSNGPDNYQGLPGLILEINDGKNLIVCTEIILNPTDKISLDEPTKGEVVTQVEFNKIQKEKSDDLMERMESRNGIDLGNGVNIKMN